MIQELNTQLGCAPWLRGKEYSIQIYKCSEIMLLMYTLEKMKNKNLKMCYTWPKCETKLRAQKPEHKGLKRACCELQSQ